MINSRIGSIEEKMSEFEDKTIQTIPNKTEEKLIL